MHAKLASLHSNKTRQDQKRQDNDFVTRQVVVTIFFLNIIILGVTPPTADPEICNSDKTKLSFAGTGPARQVSADLPLPQHVATKTQRLKYRFVARNAATRRFSAKASVALQIARKSSKCYFAEATKTSLVWCLAAKAGLLLQTNPRVAYGARSTTYQLAQEKKATMPGAYGSAAERFDFSWLPERPQGQWHCRL